MQQWVPCMSWMLYGRHRAGSLQQSKFPPFLAVDTSLFLCSGSISWWCWSTHPLWRSRRLSVEECWSLGTIAMDESRVSQQHTRQRYGLYAGSGICPPQPLARARSPALWAPLLATFWWNDLHLISNAGIPLHQSSGLKLKNVRKGRLSANVFDLDSAISEHPYCGLVP
jgi:hypothetical protein